MRSTPNNTSQDSSILPERQPDKDMSLCDDDENEDARSGDQQPEVTPPQQTKLQDITTDRWGEVIRQQQSLEDEHVADIPGEWEGRNFSCNYISKQFMTSEKIK
jgi:hypothetical protein